MAAQIDGHHVYTIGGVITDLRKNLIVKKELNVHMVWSDDFVTLAIEEPSRKLTLQVPISDKMRIDLMEVLSNERC